MYEELTAKLRELIGHKRWIYIFDPIEEIILDGSFSLDELKKIVKFLEDNKDAANKEG